MILGREILYNFQFLQISRPSSSMFPTTCATTSSLSEHARVSDRHTDVHLLGVHLLVASLQGQLGFQGQCLPFQELTLQAVWAQTLTTLLLKLQTYPQIKSPLHFYGTSGLLPLINFFLSHLLTPTTRTLPPCRQHHSTPLIKIHLMPLTGRDNPLLCHYFCYYLK